MAEIRDVRVAPVDGTPKLCITFDDGRALHIVLSDQVALVLNAGGWMMREHAARVFEADLNGPNPVSRRLRMIDVGVAEI
jgi:hypothetical protein